jgi:hypothetical protein
MITDCMKVLVVVFLICLLLVGTVSAKAATSSISSSVANPAISSGIFTTLAYTGCSDDSASVGTLAGMGDLDVDSIPDGASITLDGSLWSSKHCISGFPSPTCYSLPVFTPYTGNVEAGTHTITIALSGYTSYSGTVEVCSQKVSYVHKTLSIIPVTAATTTATTTPTTVATTTATTSATTSATTAPVTVVTSAPTTSTTLASVSASGTSSTAVPAGSGSLSVTTTPAGAAVYIDGVQRGVSPATIPGLAAGSHTVLLKLNGYQDLSTPVSITAGTMNEFSTGLTQLPAGGSAIPSTTATGIPAAATRAQSPGFEAVFGLAALGVLLYLRKES